MTGQPLKKRFLESLAGSEFQHVAEELLGILEFPAEGGGISEAFENLTLVISCLKEILPQHKQTWQRYAKALPYLIGRALAEEIASAKKGEIKANKQNSRNRWRGRFKDFPLLGVLFEVADAEIEPYVLPAKSILFAAKSLEMNHDYLVYFRENCDSVRLAHHSKHAIASVLKIHFPAWLSGEPDWQDRIKELSSYTNFIKARTGRFGEHIPPKAIILRSLVGYFEALLAIQNKEAGPAAQPAAFSIEQSVDEEELDDLQHFKDIRIIVESPPSPHSDTEAGAPRQIRALQEPDFEATREEPSVSSQQYDKRYSNYRTRTQKQILPWSWDILNPIEIERLQLAIHQCANRDAGGVLAWLMLMTGMPLHQITSLEVTETLYDRAGMDRSGKWLRTIPQLENAYKPSRSQKEHLEHHADFVVLQLPDALPKRLREALLLDKTVGLHPGPSLSQILQVTDAETALRSFLAKARLANQGRFTVGRIRKTLAAYVMKHTGDPVIVHLLTGLRTDLPPTGTYYAGFEVSVIQNVYREATCSILNA